MKKKKIFIFISILGIIVYSPSVLLAWFSESSQVNQPVYDHFSGISDNPSELYIYDNVVSGQDKLASPYLMPSTNDFIPADRININMPLQILFESSFSGSDSLDALLNANLALQLLMEQYKELQKRSVELFKSLNIPYLEQLENKTIQNMNISLNQEESKTMSEIEQDNIRLQIAKLRHQITETVRNKPAGAFYLSDKEIPSFAGLKIEGEVKIENGNKIFSVADSGMGMLTRGDTFKRGEGVSLALSGTSEGDGINNDISGRAGTDSIGINSSSNQSELPWIFRVVLRSFGYVVENKFESMFYSVILFSIFYLIFIKSRE